MTRNFYRLSSLTAVAALGLGLMVSGCGKSGSITPYPFGPVPPGPSPSPEPSPSPSPSPSPVSDKGTLKIEFSLLDAKAEVPAIISSYNFYLMAGEEENTSLLDVEKKADEGAAGEQTVTIEDVDTEVDSVVIEYLNADGKVAGLSMVPAEIIGGEETVLSDFDCLMASSLELAGSKDYIAPGEEISFAGTVIYGDEADETIERDVSNDDIDYSVDDESVLEPKEGENGTFSGKSVGEATVTAVYMEGIEADALVYVTDAELEQVVIAESESGDAADNIYFLYSEDVLPDNFTEPVEMNLQYRVNSPVARPEEDGDADEGEIEITGVNSAKFCLVGIMSDDSEIPLTADEWSVEGDFLSYDGEGKEITLTASAAGTDGKLSASYSVESSDGAAGEAMTAEASVTALGASARLAIFWDGVDVSSCGDEIELPIEYSIGEWQMVPCGYYEYTAPNPDPVPDPRVENYNQEMDIYGPLAPKSYDEVEWSISGAPDYITISKSGVLKIGGQAQVGDKGTITYNIEGCSLEMPTSTSKLVR